MTHAAYLFLSLALLPHPLQSGRTSMSEMPRHSSRAQPAEMTSEAQREVEVWIDLSVPALSSAARDKPEAREALRARIEEQQDAVMSQLKLLGAKEQARILHVRNSLAVRMPASALDQVRDIRGVVNVRKVRHIQRST
jgi:hypothetical protein